MFIFFSILLYCRECETEYAVACSDKTDDHPFFPLYSFQNPDYLQYSINTALCSLNSVVHKEDDEPKMMDTV